MPYKKSEVIKYAREATSDDVWQRFIASNPAYLKAAHENKIDGPSDVTWFFEQASYAAMRSSFPSRSHGRGIIGPKIVSIQQLEKQKQEELEKKEHFKEKLSEKAKSNQPSIQKDMIGKRIVHTASTAASFGAGVIIAVKGECITVDFDSVGKKPGEIRFRLDTVSVKP